MHAEGSSRISLLLHPSLFNVVVEGKRSGEKLEWTAAASAAAAAAMQKGEEPISEPNWAAKRPLVRPSLQFGVEMWLVMFPNENGGEGGEHRGGREPILHRDRSDHRRRRLQHQPRVSDKDSAKRAEWDLISHQSRSSNFLLVAS